MRGIKWCPSSPGPRLPPSSSPRLFCRDRSLQPGKHCSSCILSFKGSAGCGLPRITWVPSPAHIWFVFLAWGFSRNMRLLPRHQWWVLGSFPGWRELPRPFPAPPCPGSGAAWPRQSWGLRGAFSQSCLHRLTFACQHVRGVLLASLMLRRPELYRLSLKPCPVGPGIMNIRTLPFYVNTY